MLKNILLLTSLFTFFNSFALHDSTYVVEPAPKYETLWNHSNTIGVNVSEMAFVNWNSGGNNSVTALLNADIATKYKDAYYVWNNNVSFNYGINAQEGRELRKTEDEIALTSTFGYRRDSLSNWYNSAKVTFNTQLTNGYRYPDTKSPISQFMAPGYAFVGIGSEYTAPNDTWKAYISPVTTKSTFVLDQRLANEGMFGVTPAVKDEEGNVIRQGKKVRAEFGFLFTSDYSREVFKNIAVHHKLSLYSDYLNKFGNIDVDWELNIDLRVNEFVKANIGAHLRYDDDVKYKEDKNNDGVLEIFGPRVQLKQLLGVGLMYVF